MFSPTASGMDATSDTFYDRYDVAINLDQWNELGLRYTSTGVEYLFNGAVVGTDLDEQYATTLNLEQVYLQGWQGDTDYEASFDNLVVVPEPGAFSFVVLGLPVVLRRKWRSE